MIIPTWTESVIWYAVYPLGFVDAPHSQDNQLTHRLPRITAWLDHMVALGCNGLLLGPIFASATHGYDTLDYFRIDPRLGDEADFDALIAACHTRGIRVMLDGVFNHLGEDHPSFKQALSNPDAPENGWFHIDRSHYPASWQDFEGSKNLVRLNHDSPEVAQLISDVMRHWLARGIDAWRLDAAYAVEPQFWRRVIPAVQQDYPEALFMGEVIHADLDTLADYPLDSITGYELWKATWSSIKDHNFFELEWTLRRHQEFCAQVRPLTFISNHDVTRIATELGPEQALVAAAVLFTNPGMPAIYYGDEGGATGTKYHRAGGDAEIRTAMPEDPDSWDPPSAWLIDHYRALIALRRQHPWLVNAGCEICELENTRLSYRMSGGEESLLVNLNIGERCLVQILKDDRELYRYEATNAA